MSLRPGKSFWATFGENCLKVNLYGVASWTRAIGMQICVAFLVAACGADDPTTPQPLVTGRLTAIVDGTVCSSSATAATLVAQGTNSTLTIGGVVFQTNGQLCGQMILHLRGSIGLGVYTLNSTAGNENTGMLFVESRATLWSTDETHQGTLTITKLDTSGLVVEGTFSFDGVNPVTSTVKAFREGAFSSSLEVSTGTGPGQ